MQEIMSASDGLLGYKDYNVADAWDNVLSKAMEETDNESKVVPLYRRWWASAAIGIIFLAAIGLMFSQEKALPTHFAAIDHIETFSLPDGSTIMLDKGSSADINDEFHLNPAVNFEGKAHFKVQKQEEGKTFKVHLSKGHIEVVGTQFTITNMLDHLEVSVNEGHVIYVLGNRKVDLFEGDKISVIDRDVLKTSGQIRNFNSWVFDRIVFKGASCEYFF